MTYLSEHLRAGFMRVLNPPKCGAYLRNYCNFQLTSLLHLAQIVITSRALLHLESFITLRPSTSFSLKKNWHSMFVKIFQISSDEGIDK